MRTQWGLETKWVFCAVLPWNQFPKATAIATIFTLWSVIVWAFIETFSLHSNHWSDFAVQTTLSYTSGSFHVSKVSSLLHIYLNDPCLANFSNTLFLCFETCLQMDKWSWKTFIWAIKADWKQLEKNISWNCYFGFVWKSFGKTEEKSSSFNFFSTNFYFNIFLDNMERKFPDILCFSCIHYHTSACVCCQV
jgi:hypothetical protein